MQCASNPCLAPLQQLDQDLSIRLPLAVAFSGGADSTALLLGAQALWGKQVLALHVNHGFQPGVDTLFVAHCEEQCMRLGVALEVLGVDVGLKKGKSLEEAARFARYRALAEMAQTHGARAVLLAQHQQDQAESVLLALSRGAGLPGLAGMAPDFVRHGVRFLRPLLQISPESMRTYLHEVQQPFFEDPINIDMRRTRGRLRHLVLPVLHQHFPAITQTLARSARHAAAAQRMLDALAQRDCAQCCTRDQSLVQAGQALEIKALQALNPDRLENLLRYWLTHSVSTDTASAPRAPSHAQLQALQTQIRACTTRGHDIALKVSSGFARRKGRTLVWES